MKVKATFLMTRAEAETRRFAYGEDSEFNFESLQHGVREIFSRPDCEMKIFWQDEDQDYITMSSDEELMEAVNFANGGTLRIFVKETEKACDELIPECNQQENCADSFLEMKSDSAEEKLHSRTSRRVNFPQNASDLKRTEKYLRHHSDDEGGSREEDGIQEREWEPSRTDMMNTASCRRKYYHKLSADDSDFQERGWCSRKGQKLTRSQSPKRTAIRGRRCERGLLRQLRQSSTDESDYYEGHGNCRRGRKFIRGQNPTTTQTGGRKCCRKSDHQCFSGVESSREEETCCRSGRRHIRSQSPKRKGGRCNRKFRRQIRQISVDESDSSKERSCRRFQKSARHQETNSNEKEDRKCRRRFLRRCSPHVVTSQKERICCQHGRQRNRAERHEQYGIKCHGRTLGEDRCRAQERKLSRSQSPRCNERNNTEKFIRRRFYDGYISKDENNCRSRMSRPTRSRSLDSRNKYECLRKCPNLHRCMRRSKSAPGITVLGRPSGHVGGFTRLERGRARKRCLSRSMSAPEMRPCGRIIVQGRLQLKRTTSESRTGRMGVRLTLTYPTNRHRTPRRQCNQGLGKRCGRKMYRKFCKMAFYNDEQRIKKDEPLTNCSHQKRNRMMRRMDRKLTETENTTTGFTDVKCLGRRCKSYMRRAIKVVRELQGHDGIINFESENRYMESRLANSTKDREKQPRLCRRNHRQQGTCRRIQRDSISSHARSIDGLAPQMILKANLRNHGNLFIGIVPKSGCRKGNRMAKIHRNADCKRDMHMPYRFHQNGRNRCCTRNGRFLNAEC